MAKVRQHEAVIGSTDGWSWSLSPVQLQAQSWRRGRPLSSHQLGQKCSPPEFPAAGLMGGSPGCGEDVGRIQMICPLSGCDWDGGGVLSLMCESSWHPLPTTAATALRPSCGVRVHISMCILMGDWSWGSHETDCVCVCYSARYEHPCVVCACVAGKAAVSHPQASVACYHGSPAAGTPPPHIPNPFFFFKSQTHLSSLSSSSSSNSSSSLSSLTHEWLPPHRLWHHCPPPNAVLWWIILYVETSSTERRGQTWMSPVHS